MEWDVQSGRPQCAGCASNFLDQQPYQSLLRLDDSPLIRADYCLKCWEEKVVTTLSGIKAYATWTGRYKIVIPVPKEEPVKKDHAQTLFRKLLASQDPGKKKLLFVLAVMLERKKILKQQKVERGAAAPESESGKRMLVYLHAETAESILIEDPRIRLIEWSAVQSEVKQMLEEELAGC